MAEEPVPHGFGQGLGALGVVHPEAVLSNHLHRRHHQDRRRHDPDVLAQIGKAAKAVHDAHDKGGEIALLPAQGIVHRHADDLGAYHVRQSGHGCREHADDKKQLAPLQKVPQQLSAESFFFFCFGLFFVFHTFFPGTAETELEIRRHYIIGAGKRKEGNTAPKKHKGPCFPRFSLLSQSAAIPVSAVLYTLPSPCFHPARSADTEEERFSFLVAFFHQLIYNIAGKFCSFDRMEGTTWNWNCTILNVQPSV